jgi:glycerol uptake facilitator-like aquaporin
MFGRQKVATLLAEFLGTGILALVFLSVQRSTIGIPYFIAIAAGAAVAIAVYYFGSVSGAQLNPAVTIALMTARKIGVTVGALNVVMQMLGGWAAYGVYHYFVSSPMQAIGGHYSARVLFAEAVGGLILALAYGAAYFRDFKGTKRALMLGGSYTLAIIVAAAAGIGIVNPAVALAVRAFAFAGSMGWGTYLLGPVLGAVIGVNLYWIFFAPAESLGSKASRLVAETAAVAPSASSSRSTTRTSTTASKRSSTAKKSTGAGRKTSSSRRTTRR